MPHKSLRSYWELLEAILGLLAVFLIGFAPITLGLIFGLLALIYRGNAPRYLPAWFCILVLAINWAMAVWVARMASRAFYMCYPEFHREEQKLLQGQGPAWTPFLPKHAPTPTSDPMAVVLGRQLPRIPWPLAPLASLWWLLHFGFGVVACLLVELWIQRNNPNAHFLVHFLVPQAISFPFTFACNVYLLLANAVWTTHRSTLSTIWRYRLLIDVAVTVIPFLIVTLTL